MEDTLVNSQSNQNSIELLPEGVSHLNEARKWSMFLAILGFIGVGFILIAAIFVGAIFSFVGDESLPAGLGFGLSAFYVILGVAYFFPIYFLFKFSQKAKLAVQERNSLSLVETISNLKLHYKFIGIMSIVMMVLYPILMIVLVVGGVLTSM